MSVNPEKLKIGACLVHYKGSELGATQGGVKINVDMDTVDIKCDQTYGQPVKRVVTAVKLTVSMTLVEIDGSFDLLLDDGKISADAIGSDLMKKGGVLQLTPLDTASDKVGYRFPNAILEPNSDYAIASSGPHTLQVKFTACADAAGTFLEKITV